MNKKSKSYGDYENYEEYVKRIENVDQYTISESEKLLKAIYYRLLEIENILENKL